MKIGIDIRLIGKKQTGSEMVFFNYVKNLALIDSENEYILFTDIADKNVLEKIKTDLKINDKKNFKVTSLSPALPLRGRGLSFLNNKFIWNLWTLPRYLKKNPVDVYHTQYILPFFVSRKIKLITTIHDISFNFYPKFIKFADLFFLKLLIPVSLKRADKIVAISEFTRDEIIKYYKIAPGKLVLAYNSLGDNFSDFDYSQDKIGNIKKKYNLPEKYILYLGTMQPRKNIPTLIQAYASIKNEIPDIKLVLAGNGKAHNFDKRINAIIEKYNLGLNVVFTGYIDEEDKPALYKLATLFIFPSLYEGFGVPLLEAMATSVPIIASDIEPHREIAGKAAEFFNPNSSQDLMKKIKEILADKNLQNDLVSRGKARLEDFSWQNTARILLAAYKETRGS